MSWSGVREFAAEIGQCFDLLVVDDLGDRLVTLSAIDSGSWKADLGAGCACAH